MEKNVAGQKWIVFAFDRNTNVPQTGDAANITANLRIDGGAASAVTDTNPTELEGGFYAFDLTQEETNGNLIAIIPSSSTTDIQVIGIPAAVYTRPPGFNASVAQTGDSFARLGAPAGASVSADVAAVKGETAAILEDTAEIGAAGAGLTALPWNAAWDAEVQSECTDALNAYAPATGAALATVAGYIDTEVQAILDIVSHAT
ncbi:MAG: hypothetical protein HS130_00830 [Deltaproteobacteria bacterium]|nr:hypothetical protein [Deltaproteobacteria bacterium]